MTSEPLIVTFADARYLPLLALWLGNLRRLGLRRIRIYSLDAETLTWCKAQRVDAEQLEWRGDLGDLWVRRVRVFSALLQAGDEFIHSDTDAVWIQNPLQAGCAAGLREDLLFSQGTIWPPDVHDRWGFVLCCGWFWARPSSALMAFFRALEADVQASGDDQMSVNRLLAAGGAQWSVDRTGDYQLPFADRLVQCWSEPIRATLSSAVLTVALLPHCEFQRLPEVSERAVVKHFVTPKNCAQKLQVLRHFGLIA
jgi:Nucleotide-diphospho-sugar transferase